MQIEVTGCNKCPFAVKYRCNLWYDKLSDLTEPQVCENEHSHVYKNDLPHNCPITLNGGEITIKTKTE